MALVNVSTHRIEEHLDNNGVDIYSFTWNQHSTTPEIEYSVKSDLEYEDEDLIEKDEYDELSHEHDQLRKEFEELSEEHESWLDKYKQLNDEFVLLTEQYNKLKQEKSLWTKLHFWK